MCLQSEPKIDGVSDYVNEPDAMKVGSRRCP